MTAGSDAPSGCNVLQGVSDHSTRIGTPGSSKKAETKNRIKVVCRDASIAAALLPHPDPLTVVNVSAVTGAKERDVWRQARTLRNDVRRVARLPPSHLYFLFNKPPGCLSAYKDHDIEDDVESCNSDRDEEVGRTPTVYDALPPGFPAGVPHVGRLDRDTEGLLLFTDDGKVQQRLACGFAQKIGRQSWAKVYHVEVAGIASTPADEAWRESLLRSGEIPLVGPVPDCCELNSTELHALAAERIAGLSTDGSSCEQLHLRAMHQLALLRWPYCFHEGVAGKKMTLSAPALVRLLHSAQNFGETVWLEFQLTEGKNRQIRKLCARSGLTVKTLRRVSMGPLELDSLPVGSARALSLDELKAIYTVLAPGDAVPRTLPIPLPPSNAICSADVAAALSRTDLPCVGRMVQDDKPFWFQLVADAAEMDAIAKVSQIRIRLET